METASFVRGMCVGMVAGVLAEMVLMPTPHRRKTAVGKVMDKMGCAVDTALEDVAQKLR